MNKWDFFAIIGILITIIGLTLLSIHYITKYKENKDLCMNNPLVYGAKKLTDTYKLEFVGSGFFKTDSNTKSPIITFNSTNFNWYN